ncbi:MAG: hypothetical protein K8T20_15750 [Planctomycetes bacterium]|nr:hypothetical protein [Planctomycetota bacterium]
MALMLGPAPLDDWLPTTRIVELGAMVALLAACAVLPAAAGRFANAVVRAADAAGRRPWRAVLALAILSLAGAAAAGLRGVPEPAIHDEFSYLLAADTFASGRLTNPPQPHWQHFETFHELSQPTRMSKFPPAQGIALAAGQLAGRPIVGVWLSTAAAVGAIAWMLFGWLPPRWAVAGGVLALLRFGVEGYWAQSYWGGSVAAFGGALVLGALPRLWKEGPTVGAAILFGAGSAILANSRPAEGLFVCGIASMALGWRAVARPGPFTRAAWIGRAALPIAACLALTVAAGAAYNRAITGNAFRLPYFIYQQEYAVTSPFLFGKPPSPPPYRHRAIASYYLGIERPVWDRQQHLSALPLETLWKWWRCVDFPFGMLALLPLAMIVPLARSRSSRFAVAAGAVFLAVMACLTFVLPHYAAPAAGLFTLLIVFAIRRIHALGRPGRRWGRLAAVALFLPSVGLLAWRVAGHDPGGDFGRRRAALVRELEATGGAHLVFVHYGPRHSPNYDWVFNAADLDAAPVVFAREIAPGADAELRASFPGRAAWKLTVDSDDAASLAPWP